MVIRRGAMTKGKSKGKCVCKVVGICVDRLGGGTVPLYFSLECMLLRRRLYPVV